MPLVKPCATGWLVYVVLACTIWFLSVVGFFQDSESASTIQYILRASLKSEGKLSYLFLCSSFMCWDMCCGPDGKINRSPDLKSSDKTNREGYDRFTPAVIGSDLFSENCLKYVFSSFILSLEVRICKVFENYMISIFFIVCLLFIEGLPKSQESKVQNIVDLSWVTRK